MADTQPQETVEVLVLQDAEGQCYALPLEVIAQYRMTEEQQAAFQQQFGEADVVGYFQAYPGLNYFPAESNVGPAPSTAYRYNILGPVTWNTSSKPFYRPLPGHSPTGH